jgi:hypothetical protein
LSGLLEKIVKLLEDAIKAVTKLVDETVDTLLGSLGGLLNITGIAKLICSVLKVCIFVFVFGSLS